MIALLLLLAHGTELELRERGSGARLIDHPVEVLTGSDARQLRTDARGRLDVDASLGSVQLIATAYHPVQLELGDEPVQLFLDPAPPMTIVVEAFDDSPHIAAHRVDAEVALETPGAAEDSFRLVQSLPGVTVQRELSPTAGDLAIRGSGPGDNRVYLDGVEIPYLYHFNQYASVLPTSLVGELTLYSSTFGARFGDATGAVVDATTRDEVPTELHGDVSLNFFTAGASLRSPLGGRWWAAIAARRSYQDLAPQDNPQYTLWPRFHDLHARVERRGEQSRTALFAYGASDSYQRAAAELDVLDPVEQQDVPSFRYRRAFDVFGALHAWSGSGTGRVVAALVADRDRGELSSGGLQRHRQTYLSSRLDWGVQTGLGRLRTGYELRTERTGLTVESAGREGVLVAEEAPALARGIDVDAQQLRASGGVYADLSLRRGDLVVIPGVRLPFDTLTPTQLPDPRLTLRWQLSDSIQLRAASGRYQQAAETQHLLAQTGDPTLPVTSAWQAAIGLDTAIADRWEIVFDAYGKLLDDPLRYPVGDVAYAAPRGRAAGVELVTRYRLRERFFFRGWLALARTQVYDGGSWHPAEGDQPLTIGLVASWDLATDYNLGLRYRYGSGQPYTPVTGGLYRADTDTYDPIAGSLNSARLPAYQKVDLRFARTFRFDRWRLDLAAELWWVPRRNAQLYPIYSYDYRDQGYVVGPTFLPILSARASF